MDQRSPDQQRHEDDPKPDSVVDAPATEDAALAPARPSLYEQLIVGGAIDEVLDVERSEAASLVYRARKAQERKPAC